MKTSTTLIVSVALIVLFFGAVLWLSGKGGAPIASIEAADWTDGALDPKVELIEYSDFQCPACAAYEPLVAEIRGDFNDTLRFAYRHFPLTQIHQNAVLAAKAAEAAGKQGKFWEMHDLLFEKQEEWATSATMRTLATAYAKELGLDTARFEADLDSKETEDKIERDYAGGLRLKVNATPTFFVNGTKIKNPGNYDEFKREIERAMERGLPPVTP
ncbi:MAG: thioredoxin domain-containing protein [bacterium]|nr:thioredoxin domain-containing protein [bacterium]